MAVNRGGNNQPRRNQNKGGGGGGKKSSNRTKLQRQARRNVNLQFQPGINSAYRTIDQNNLDFQNQDLGVQSIYGALPQHFDTLNREYANRTENIGDDLAAAQQRFSSALNQEGLPMNEVMANTAVYGTLGNNFANHLASNDQRALQWNQSGEREGMLSERYARQNLLQDLSDNQQMQYNRIADIQDQKRPAIAAELENLRAERQANQQSKAYADMIANMTGGYLNGGGGGGGGRGGAPPRRNAGGGGGGGGGTRSWASIDNQGMSPNAGQGPGGGGGDPNAGRVNYTGPIPSAWDSATHFSKLPPILQEMYLRDEGTNPRTVFRQTTHPLFDNFETFWNAYEQFLPEINRLWRNRAPGTNVGGF